MDIASPVKMEIVLHPDDILHPIQYAPSKLHRYLTPNFQHSVFNNGVYVLLGNDKKRIGVYIYQFTTTIAATSTKKDNLDYNKILVEENCEMNSIFPSNVNLTFHIFEVPVFFVDDVDFKKGIEKGIKKGIKRCLVKLSQAGCNESVKILEKETCEDDIDDLDSDDQAQAYDDQAQAYRDDIDDQVHKLKGNENILNERLSAWIKEELEKLPEEYVMSFDQSSDHEHSRHNRSEEDFAFYVKPRNQCLNGGAIHAVDLSDPEHYVENCTLASSSGDSKNLAEDKHTFQLLANMNKTAGDLGVAALKANVLFNKMVIFGLLVEYDQKSVKKLLKLEVDYEKMKTLLKIVNQTNSLPIQNAFSMVCEAMKQAVVPK